MFHSHQTRGMFCCPASFLHFWWSDLLPVPAQESQGPLAEPGPLTDCTENYLFYLAELMASLVSWRAWCLPELELGENEHGGGRGRTWPWKGHDWVFQTLGLRHPFFVNQQPSVNSFHAVPFPLSPRMVSRASQLWVRPGFFLSYFHDICIYFVMLTAGH